MSPWKKITFWPDLDIPLSCRCGGYPGLIKHEEEFIWAAVCGGCGAIMPYRTNPVDAAKEWNKKIIKAGQQEST